MADGLGSIPLSLLWDGGGGGGGRRGMGGGGRSLLLHFEEPRLREIEPLISALPAPGAEGLNGV